MSNDSQIEMTPSRAIEINSACCESAMSVLMGPEYVCLPAGVELEEMLVATRIVAAMEDEVREEDGRTIRTMRMTCDPRLLALHYAFERYERDPRQMLRALGFELGG